MLRRLHVVSARPKSLLDRLARRHGRGDGRELREEVAGCTDVDALARAYPTGFEPFLAALRSALGAAA